MANIKQRLLASSILIAGLGLYSPIYKQIYNSYRSVREHSLAKLGQPTEPIRKPCYKYRFKTRSKTRSKTTLPKSSSGIGIAVSPDGEKVYRQKYDGIEVIDKKTGRQEYFELPYWLPELSWATDIAYDSKRDLVSMVSLGGEGYFYRFDAKKRRWLDAQSLYNMDLKSLTYDPTSDRYVAWSQNYGRNSGDLVFLSETGELIARENISHLLAGFNLLYDTDNQMPPAIEIVARGNNITLMTHARNSVRYIWYYDLESKTARLAFKSRNFSKIYSD